VLVSWNGNSDQNMNNFFKLTDFFESNYTAKMNTNTIIFCFKDKEAMTKFLDYIGKMGEKFGLKGRIEWRRACKAFQELKPELWKNAKEFTPDLKD
jgi:hypothetical protein